MAQTAVHLIVHGRVQGVGYRFFARQQASALGLSGWVRNLPDGSVEVLAEGDRESLSELISRLDEGPSFGHVSSVEVEWTEPRNTYAAFSIAF